MQTDAVWNLPVQLVIVSSSGTEVTWLNKSPHGLDCICLPTH